MIGAPKVGDRGVYRHMNLDGTINPEIVAHFVVVRIKGNICWARYNDAEKPSSFIWRFKDGANWTFNKLHEWPGRVVAEGRA